MRFERIGCHDVTALIGEGGMGQVYQATDTKLNRQVALKILPKAFPSAAERLARFQREAQVLASLNHPGIAAIYGIEEADDTRALVLELVGYATSLRPRRSNAGVSPGSIDVAMYRRTPRSTSERLAVLELADVAVPDDVGQSPSVASVE